MIDPTARIHPKARISAGAVIGPYVVIESPHVVVEENVVIKAHVYLDGHTRIGKNTTIWPFASIGTQTQDLKYRGEVTYVDIGEGCQIREYVTINSSCGDGTKVSVGDRCLIMAYCHIAHNCTLGSHVIMSNGATLAGHVTVGDHAVLGGVCAVHQWTRIGAYSMVGGGSMVSQDLPPFCIGSGFPLRVVGLNIIGLKRHRFSLELRKQLIRAYRLTYQSNLHWNDARAHILAELPMTPHLQTWIAFCDHTTRGLSMTRRRRTPEPELVNA